MLTATLTAVPFSLAPSVRAPAPKHFFLVQENSTIGGCSGGGNTLCFNGTTPGPTITVNQGDSVTITVHNNDTTSHTFTLTGAYSGQSITNSPGQTQSLVFTASTPEPTPGIDYMCTFPGHSAAGMHGKFVVTPTSSLVSPLTVVGLILTAATSVFVISRRRR